MSLKSVTAENNLTNQISDIKSDNFWDTLNEYENKIKEALNQHPKEDAGHAILRVSTNNQEQSLDAPSPTRPKL